MAENKKNDTEFITLDQDGNKQLDLHVLVKALVQQAMGKALDYARCSGMSDRSLTQYERLVKDDFYKIINYGQRILEEHGYPAEK